MIRWTAAPTSAVVRAGLSHAMAPARVLRRSAITRRKLRSMVVVMRAP